MAKPKVFIIDDDHGILVMLSDALAEDFAVAAYPNAAEAMKALNLADDHQLPAAIITDVMMPGMDGYSFQNELAMDDKTRAIPIIVMSAKGGLIENFRHQPNVAAFIEKPFDYKHLVRITKKAIEDAKR